MALPERPRMERFLEPPNTLESNGLAVFLSRHEDDWTACLTDVTGEAVFVEMRDVDEVIATLAACRWMVDRDRPGLDLAWQGFAEMARQSAKANPLTAPVEG